MAAPAAPRSGRSLTVLALVIIALYSWMFISGNTTPKLGLDLRGGTSLTLTPYIPPGEQGEVTDEAVDQAVKIMRDRIDGLGVAEASVSKQGSGSSATIVAQAPGTNDRDLRNQLGQTAKLTFRPVLVVAGPAPITASPSPSPSASGSTKPSTSASPKASGTTPSPLSTLSPSPSTSGNGRPAAGLPLATTSASPTPTPTPTATPAPSPSPSTSASADPTASITAADEAAFKKLDCSKPIPVKQRPADVSTKLLITCGDKQDAKYILAPVAVAGTNVSGAAANLSGGQTQVGSSWVVDLTFDGTGAQQFAKTTQELISKASPQNQFAIVLDGAVVSAPVVQGVIANGQAQISGNFTQQSSTDLANVLKYGSLPLAFELSDSQTISPTLGADQLRAGLIAGLLGLALVVVYSLLYYRGLGLVTVASLLVAGLLTFGMLVLLGKSIGYTLTLAGIAGAIVSIGITADSFIVFFERIRDEMRDGRTLRVAVETGWKRARRTILAADAVSMIAALALYFLSVGAVRGFAFTLGLTTVIDVVVVFFFTKPLMSILSRTKFFSSGSKWSGVDPSRLSRRPVLPVPVPVPKSTGLVTAKEI